MTTNFLVNTLLENREMITIDGPSQFYLAFRWTFQNTTVEFVEAQKLSQACGIELDIILKAGLIKKTGSKITVLDAINRTKINLEEAYLVNIMHLSLIAWKEGDENRLKEIFLSSDFLTKNEFLKFCQAVAECLPQNNVEKQLLEGFLISKYCT